MLIFGSVEAAELSFFFSFYRPVWFSTERWLHLDLSFPRSRKEKLTSLLIPLQTWLESRNAKQQKKCAKIDGMLVGHTGGMRIVSYPNKGCSFECSCIRVSKRAAREIARGGVSRDQMAQKSRVVA